MLCAFQCKLRPSGVSLESSGLENKPKVAWNRGEFGLTHDAREAVSATISVWKCGGILFRPRSYQESVQKAFLCPFRWKPRPSRVSLEPAEMEYIPQVPGNRPEVGQNHDLRKTVSATLSFLKVKWGYISVKKLESERSKSFAVSISLKTKTISS